MSMFGAWGKKTRGQVVLSGKTIGTDSPQTVIEAGISLATEDRKRYGLVLTQDIRHNMSLASLMKISSAGVVDDNEEIRHAEKYTAELKIKTPSIEQKTVNLSGGNQQKVVLGKWLMTGPTVLILDEPTRGIDVGAKLEIYSIINDLVDQGVGVIMISSDLPELLGMADRILVMHEGQMTGDLPWEQATQENIMRCATGGAA
jgi:putative multiple sugar transport system ATP-binding protein